MLKLDSGWLFTAGFTLDMCFSHSRMLRKSEAEDKSPPLSVVLSVTEGEREQTMEGGGRTNRLCNISENTTHCPLCVLPDRNKDCHS